MATSEKLGALLHSLYSDWANAGDSIFGTWMLPPNFEGDLTDYKAIFNVFKDETLAEKYKDAKETGDLMLSSLQLGLLDAALRSFMLRILNPARAYITSSTLYGGNLTSLNMLSNHLSILAANVNEAKNELKKAKT